MLSFTAAAQDKITVNFWHAMGGHNLEVTETLVERFNEQHDNIEVVPQNTGTYNDTLTKTESAVRSGDAPHIVQIYEIGTQVMVDSEIIIPIEELGREVAEDNSFDWGKFLTPVSDYYQVDGELHSMPFNSSTPILYYNKDAFEEAGLDRNDPPQTFSELKEYAENAESSGYELGTAFLPRPDGVDRGGVIIGGASLWALRDHPEEELEAAWEFLSFLSEEEQQVYWFEQTGYFF